jgi:sulfonate transport system substrate-binding protein
MRPLAESRLHALRADEGERNAPRPAGAWSRRARKTAVVLLALALAACGKPQGAEQAVLKIGSQKGGDKALLLASGALDGAPYRVEWSDFPAAQHLLEALAAGAVDLGLVGDAPFLFAYAGGANIKAVQASANPQGGVATAILLPKGSKIRSPADLRGRRIATGRGSIGHYLLLRVMEQAGLKPSDVTIVFLAPSDAKAAFATGSVDAWSTWAPYLPMAVRDEGARVLTDGRGLLTGYGFEAASTPAIAAKRVLLQDYLLRLGRAELWAQAHQAAYAKVLSKETGLDDDIARKTVALNLRTPRPIDAAVIAEEAEVLKRFQASGGITAKPNLAAGFDTTFKVVAP